MPPRLSTVLLLDLLPSCCRSSSIGNYRCLPMLSTTTRRHESSYRRSRGRLNVKPEASFVPSANLIQNHILFNPPASASSVLHTPTKFLPKNDPRHALFQRTASMLATTSSSSQRQARLPPMVKKGITDYPTHHLQKAEVEEIRKLRGEDPDTWTTRKLANKFGCSASFVRIVAPLDRERRDLHYKKLEVVKGTWGPIRRRAREDRTKRKVMAKSDAYTWPLE